MKTAARTEILRRKTLQSTEDVSFRMTGYLVKTFDLPEKYLYKMNRPEKIPRKSVSLGKKKVSRRGTPGGRQI